MGPPSRNESIIICPSIGSLVEHPTFKAAVRRIVAACNAHGKLARGSAETEAQFGAESAGE
jgi:hypothetical protein